jgi:hypothetical protein
MRKEGLAGTALVAILLFATSAGAGDPPTDVARLADWLIAQCAPEKEMQPWPTRSEPPPQTTFSDPVALKRFANDAARSPYERMAALALLGAGDAERRSAIREFFEAACAGFSVFSCTTIGRKVRKCDSTADQ